MPSVKVRESAAAKGIAIRRSGSNFDIQADAERMTQALANILSTALRLLPAGSIIEADVARLNDEVTITIISSRADVQPDRLELLFDRYRQSDSDLALEMSVSREIIELHGGTLEVATPKERGCVFCVRLSSPAPA